MHALLGERERGREGERERGREGERETESVRERAACRASKSEQRGPTASGVSRRKVDKGRVRARCRSSLVQVRTRRRAAACRRITSRLPTHECDTIHREKGIDPRATARMRVRVGVTASRARPPPTTKRMWRIEHNSLTGGGQAQRYTSSALRTQATHLPTASRDTPEDPPGLTRTHTHLPLAGILSMLSSRFSSVPNCRSRFTAVSFPIPRMPGDDTMHGAQVRMCVCECAGGGGREGQ